MHDPQNRLIKPPCEALGYLSSAYSISKVLATVPESGLWRRTSRRIVGVTTPVVESGGKAEKIGAPRRAWTSMARGRILAIVI